MKRQKHGLQTVLAILLALIFLSPLYILVVNSFKTQKGIFSNVLSLPSRAYFTLNNYVEAWKQLDFLKSLWNSLYISVSATVLIILFTSMAAWVLVRHKSALSNIIFYIFALSMLIPFQCVMLPLVQIMGKIGFLNPAGLIFMYLGFGSSLSIVMYHGFIKNIPLELEEAATIDGATPFRVFWHIVFPLLKSTTVTIAVLNLMWIWNDFLLPQLVINKPAWQTIPLKTFYFFGQYSKRWDLATAGLLLGMIPIVIFYLFAQKYIVKGVTDGAIK